MVDTASLIALGPVDLDNATGFPADARLVPTRSGVVVVVACCLSYRLRDGEAVVADEPLGAPDPDGLAEALQAAATDEPIPAPALRPGGTFRIVDPSRPRERVVARLSQTAPRLYVAGEEAHFTVHGLNADLSRGWVWVTFRARLPTTGTPTRVRIAFPRLSYPTSQLEMSDEHPAMAWPFSPAPTSSAQTPKRRSPAPPSGPGEIFPVPRPRPAARSRPPSPPPPPAPPLVWSTTPPPEALRPPRPPSPLETNPKILATPRPAAPAPEVKKAPAPEPPKVVELLWFHDDTPKKLRDVPAWKELLEEEQEAPPEIGFDDRLPDPVPKDVQERKEVFLVLRKAAPTDAAGIDRAIAEAIDDDGFSPPLVLLSGELTLPFDGLETLQATVHAVEPLVAKDKRLREAVESAKELLKSSWLEDDIANGFTNRIKEAFAASPTRILPPDYLEQHTKRILLVERRFQKRTVFGAQHVRAVFAATAGATPIPTYLPEAVSTKLPLYPSMQVRFIAEAHAQQDQYETHAVALQVVAFGRVVHFGPKTG